MPKSEMRPPEMMLKSALNALLSLALGLVVLAGVLIAWWIAVVAGMAFASYLLLRRILRGGKAQSGGPVVIEGEYKVEPEALPRQPRSRS